MVLDAVSNFVRGNADAAVGTSDTTVSVADASIFPDPSTDGEFNVVIWDVNNFPRPDQDGDVEIMRVTARDTTADELTVTRGQEMTSAAAHPEGSAIHLSPTAKMFSDIESTFGDFWDAGTQELTADVNNTNTTTQSLEAESVSTEESVTVTTDGPLHYGNEPDDPDDNFDNESVIVGTDVDVPGDNERGAVDDGRYLIIGHRAAEDANCARLTAIGYRAGAGLEDHGNICIGDRSAADIDHPEDPEEHASGLVAVGNKAAQFSAGMDDCTAIGQISLEGADGAFNTAVGYRSGRNMVGDECVVIGKESGMDSDGEGLVAIGFQAGKGNDQNESVMIGNRAGRDNGDFRLTAVGRSAADGNMGGETTIIGAFAGRDNEGDAAVGLGAFALDDNTGHGVIGIGHSALENNAEDDIFVVTNQNGDPKFKLDLISGDLQIAGEITENASL